MSDKPISDKDSSDKSSSAKAAPDLIFGVIVNVLRRREAGIRILSLLRSGGKFEGQWWPVGGTCEGSETPIQTALRELKEETQLEAIELYALGQEVKHTDGTSKLEAFVAYVAPDAEVILNYEHSDFRWVTLNEMYQSYPKEGSVFLDHLDHNFIASAPSSKNLLL